MARRTDKRRALQEKFRKRSYNLLRKANELSQQTGSDIYVLIYRNHRYYSYQSTDREGWPASEQDIRDHYPPTVARRPDNFEKPNEEHVEAQKEEPDIVDQGLSEETLFEQGRRVIFMPKTPLLRLEPKSQTLSRTSLAEPSPES